MTRTNPLASKVWVLVGTALLCLWVSFAGCQGCQGQPSTEVSQEQGEKEAERVSIADHANQEKLHLEDPKEEVVSPEESEDAGPVEKQPSNEDPPEQAPTGCLPGQRCFRWKSSEVRACQFILTLPEGTKVQEVTFHPQLRGRTQQAKQRLGVAFFFQQNKALPNQEYAFQIKITPASPNLPLSPQNMTCYDWNGRPINNPEWQTKEP
ncbi:MAG: hypothetical protein EP343_28000 [Deltaproteobacteria bacterium]|nr:MAG: hypothetical protein EP343_28000 [Deltaproteobacteria bacterium]